MRQSDLNTSEKVKALLGSKVKTNSVLDPSTTFAATVQPQRAQSRRPDAEGIVIAQPGQCGGDGFIIDHQDGTLPAPYWFYEFERVC